MTRTAYLAGVAMPLLLLGGCGDSGGGVASTPAPTPAAAPTPSPTPAPTPAPAVNYDTAEYHRSNAAAQAQAITAYNNGATGQGVLVGVIDSGVDATSAEFAGRISPLSGDFAGSRGVGDAGGHGTAVSDVLLGAKNDTGIHGVAFNATLLALRTDTPGSCTPTASGSDGGCSHNDNAIAAALDAATSAKARVVNISLGGSPPNANLRGAISRATAAGTIIVISAGNDGMTDPVAAQNPDLLAQVANDAIARGRVIIAGAVDANSALADFSNKAGNSATHYLAALGVRVRAVDNTGTSYVYSGTSFSAPTVAGAVALLAQAFPSLTADQIVSLLFRSANDLGTVGVDATYGNGELNIARAFQPQGATSLAGSQVAVSLTDNATLGTAMGDAGRGSLGAVVRDAYGRDFAVDLSGTVKGTAPPLLLASALATDGRTLSAVSPHASIALAIDAGTVQRLTLDRGETARARLLAGAVAVRLSRTMKLGIAGGRGADGLLPSPQELSAPAFLIADRSLDRAPVGAFALRQQLGGIAIAVVAETGRMQLWQAGATGPMSDGIRRYPYASLSLAADGAVGPLALSGRVTRFDERATVLGARFGAALGGSGAVSWFADAGAALAPLAKWRLSAAFRQGWTELGANDLRGRSTLRTQALSADVRRTDLWAAGDSLALRYFEPLRVVDGGLALRLADPLSLTPTGHERDWETVYSRPFGPGWVSANAYLRHQPGNFARAPDDGGIAVRYSFSF